MRQAIGLALLLDEFMSFWREAGVRPVLAGFPMRLPCREPAVAPICAGHVHWNAGTPPAARRDNLEVFQHAVIHQNHALWPHLRRQTGRAQQVLVAQLFMVVSSTMLRNSGGWFRPPFWRNVWPSLTSFWAMALGRCPETSWKNTAAARPVSRAAPPSIVQGRGNQALHLLAKLRAAEYTALSSGASKE